MPFPPDVFATIRTLIANDDALLKCLSEVKTPADAAQILAGAASAQGLQITAEQIEAHIAAQQSQQADTISDASLAEVAAGMDPMSRPALIAMIIFSAGFACLFYSDEHPVNKNAYGQLPSCVTT